MNRSVNALIGLVAFACIIILGKTGGAQARKSAQQPVEAQDFVFIGLVVASMFFLQFAIERYLVPLGVFTKEQMKQMSEAAETGYRKTFFRGAIGLGYFFLILYVFEYLRPLNSALEIRRNCIPVSAFFLFLGLLARARGIILYLSEQAREANQKLISPQTRTGSEPVGQ